MNKPPANVKGDRIRAADGVKVDAVVVPAGMQAGGLVNLEGAEGEGQSQAQGLMEQSRHRSHALLSAAQQEAADLLAEAQQQAALLLAEARQEAEALRGGLEKQVRSELESEYSKRFKAAASALEAAGKELCKRQCEYLERIEQPALSLVLAIARHLIRAEWKQDSSALARMVGAALRQLQPEDVALLYLSPETYAAVSEGAGLSSALSENGVRIGQIRLEADPALSAGQFALSSGNVAVNFDLDNALAEMAAHLRLAASGQLGGAPDGESAPLEADAEVGLSRVEA